MKNKKGRKEKMGYMDFESNDLTGQPDNLNMLSECNKNLLNLADRMIAEGPEETIMTKVSDEIGHLKTAIDDLVKLADEIHSGKEIREYITAQMRNLQAYAEGWETE